MNDKVAFYVIRNAIERARPELIETIQGRQELDRMTLEIMTALKEAGLHVVTPDQKEAGDARWT